MEPNATIREEELKNILRESIFSDYDATHIIGDIDFAVTTRRENPAQTELFEREWFLWAESKKGSSHSLIDSFIQLIITIGKAHTHEKHMPPMFLGAFDAEKIAFIEFHHVISIFYRNDFNWNVTPSNHNTKEFKLLKELIKGTLNEHIATFNLKKDEKPLRQFIKKNFRVGDKTGVNITKNNYLFVFQRWAEEVKPTINALWEDIPATRIVDFFYADLISQSDYTLSSDLAVVLRGDEYKIMEQILKSGRTLFSECKFNDEMKAYRAFWNKYKRPPRQEAIDIILDRRDLLIPHNLRQYQGAFYTPPQWVELSQRYLAEELGEEWQQQYYVWDCCAGTGNLLFGLTEPYRVWASTLDLADVQVMKNRIDDGELNLLEKHVFQFDFLNDDFANIPESLSAVINDPEERKKLIVYINPPYAEAGNKSAMNKEETKNKDEVSKGNATHVKYKKKIGAAANELFALFLSRIFYEIPNSIIAEFSTLKILQSPNFDKFRTEFKAQLGRNFIVPASSFDNVTGMFPIGFFIWHLDQQQIFTGTKSDKYDTKGNYLGIHTILCPPKKRLWMDWLKTMHDKKGDIIGFLRTTCSDFQNQNGSFITNQPSANDILQRRTHEITVSNFYNIVIAYAVRYCIAHTWLNHNDQLLYPIDDWQTDYEFRTDCLVYALFHNKNNIRSSQGVNHWIPFTENEIGTQDNIASHFMSDYLSNEHKITRKNSQTNLFTDLPKQEQADTYRPIDHLSQEAKSVMDAGRELWKYYHKLPGANPNASYYDIRLHFQGTKTTKNGKEQMNPDSTDATYTTLNNNLRQAMRQLAAHIEPKVYQYGFLK